MNAIKLTDKVYWVGAIDWKIRDFHGYTTDKGTTYNAYLILADKVTLVDTVKAPFKDEMMARITSVILCAGALLVGSPTLNNQLFPTVADMLVYIKGLKFKVPMGAAFGSYGWSGESVKHINETLKEMKIELANEGLNVRYVPRREDLDKCVKLGILVGEKLENY